MLKSRVLRRCSWLVCWIIVCCSTVSAQKASLKILPGERISYGVYFNWHFLWVNAAEVTFRADTIRYAGKPAWKLGAEGHTLKAYDLLYSVRDTFSSILGFPDFTPIHFSRSVHHGGASSFQSYQFNTAKGTAKFIAKADGQPTVEKQIECKSSVYDVLSEAYRFRRYNFGELELEQSVRFSMLVDDKVSQYTFRYKGLEAVKTRNGRQFNCHKIAVWMQEGEFFPEGEVMYIWFTADRNKIPLMVETKIRIGSVKVVFLDAKSLPFPLNSEIH